MKQPLLTTFTKAWLLVGSLSLCSCMVGPNYEKPEIDMPEGFRTASGTTEVTTEDPIDELKVRDIVQDPHLLALLEEAVDNNLDLEIAAARVLEADALHRHSKSNLYPKLGIGGSWTAAESSRLGPTPIPDGGDRQTDYTTLALNVPTYQIDFWGQVRRSNQAARARLLASEFSRQVVLQTIITQTMTLYQELVRLDREHDITIRTLRNRLDSLKLTKNREEGGVASLLDVRQAEVLVETAKANQIEVERQTYQIENELSVLLGRNPGPISRRAVDYTPLEKRATAIGMPSNLLLRRPDIQAAEQRVIQANADIGSVKAAYFPNIYLTGSFGFQSTELEELFSSNAQTWQFVPSINLPVFTAGQRKADMDIMKARFDLAVSSYKKTVQNAFREVSDALIGYQHFHEFRLRQEAKVESYRDATRLSNLRYEGGVTDYFEVLYNEQEYFTAHIALMQAARNEAVALIQLFRALGGGVDTTLQDLNETGTSESDGNH